MSGKHSNNGSFTPPALGSVITFVIISVLSFCGVDACCGLCRVPGVKAVCDRQHDGHKPSTWRKQRGFRRFATYGDVAEGSVADPVQASFWQCVLLIRLRFCLHDGVLPLSSVLREVAWNSCVNFCMHLGTQRYWEYLHGATRQMNATHSD
mmetsp:Transcript_30107/g.80353  ORF Transcript_30107/g.80353 Transcript_30107/m.80353 type:complete len:151 (-) Transcript_30107:83-535(-)